MAHVLPGSWIPFRSSRGMDKEEMTGGEGGTIDRLGWRETWGRHGEIGGSPTVTVTGLRLDAKNGSHPMGVGRALEGARHRNSHRGRGQVGEHWSYRCTWNWDAPVPRSRTKAINFVRIENGRRPRDRTLPGVFSESPLVPSFGLAPFPSTAIL